jgi:hypothetical protein
MSAESSVEVTQAAVAHPVHEGLHGIVALDHPFALLGLVVISGVVLFAANWRAKRKAKKP